MFLRLQAWCFVFLAPIFLSACYTTHRQPVCNENNQIEDFDFTGTYSGRFLQGARVERQYERVVVARQSDGFWTAEFPDRDSQEQVRDRLLFRACRIGADNYIETRGPLSFGRKDGPFPEDYRDGNVLFRVEGVWQGRNCRATDLTVRLLAADTEKMGNFVYSRAARFVSDVALYDNREFSEAGWVQLLKPVDLIELRKICR